MWGQKIDIKPGDIVTIGQSPTKWRAEECVISPGVTALRLVPIKRHGNKRDV
jgi:hypothetical protein